MNAGSAGLAARAAARSTRVDLYYADRGTLTDEAVAALVTAEDRERSSGTMLPRRRAEYLAGRALLRHAIAEVSGRAPSSLQFVVSPTGKPACVDGPAISLSHSGDAVVCAVANVSVGVDVETVRERSVAGIAERHFTPAEARWLDTDPANRFTMLWVLKEAYLKAVGLGFAGGLASIECRIEPPLLTASVATGAETPRLELLAGEGLFVGVAALDAFTPIELALHSFSPEGNAGALRAIESIAKSA
jgi:phosphopantetheinyl transferase